MPAPLGPKPARFESARLLMNTVRRYMEGRASAAEVRTRYRIWTSDVERFEGLMSAAQKATSGDSTSFPQ